jgi:Colicin immunity protein / pyocin immunity protein.
MTRDELIELGKRIVNCEGTEEEIDAMYELFSNNVPHPNGANLFFYPENYNARKDNLSQYHPTVEEIVDKALSYKPIQI